VSCVRHSRPNEGGGADCPQRSGPKTLGYRYTSTGFISAVHSRHWFRPSAWLIRNSRPHRLREIIAGFENLSARKVGYRLQHHEHLTQCNRRNAMCHLPAPSFFVPAGTRGLDMMMPVAYCSVLAFWLGFMTSIRVVLFSFSTVLLHVVFSHLLTTLTLHHTFTVSFQAQNSPFPQIFSTRVC